MFKANLLGLMVVSLILSNFSIQGNHLKAEQFNVGGVYKVVGTNPSGTKYRGKVTIVKTGDKYNFAWKVGSSYYGNGTLTGDILTVHWGSKHPVIYIVKNGGNLLVGTWANGKATETLSK